MKFGIQKASVYIPRCYVEQSDLEARDGCIGKYTQGLGQLQMGVWNTCVEDVQSIALTAAREVLQGTDVMDIGCVRVGTETLIDKSKSMKTVIMNLLEGNDCVEGVTHVNACYGATDALFSAIAWMQSDSWTGKLALVVAADTAEYEPGSAGRVTGGAGAVAMLVGPNAALVLEPRRITVSGDVHDFYKPELEVYPRVDGKLSQRTYLAALERCVEAMRESVHDCTHWCLHAPYGKLVRKGYAKIHECLGSGDEQELYDKKVSPGLLLSKYNGNMYTASLYACIACVSQHAAPGERIACYSYGSGFVSSLFVLAVSAPLPLTGLERLVGRTRVVPDVMDAMLAGDGPRHVWDDAITVAKVEDGKKFYHM